MSVLLRSLVARRTVATIITAACCLFLCLPVVVFADPVPPIGNIPKDSLDQLTAVGQGAGYEQQSPSLELVIARIINATLGAIGIVLVGLTVYAGWMWMISGGETEKIEKAKKMLLNAIIGLVIILLAYAISRFVITKLLIAAANVR
ncbi:MAG: pilin [Candidatus Uhrbacteria bacterium]